MKELFLKSEIGGGSSEHSQTQGDNGDDYRYHCDWTKYLVRTHARGLHREKFLVIRQSAQSQQDRQEECHRKGHFEESGQNEREQFANLNDRNPASYHKLDKL